jgi:phage gpG-like protein
MSVTATIVGDAAVKARLLAGASAATSRETELALVAGALLIQNAAKAHAPYLSGTLRRSIHIGGHTFEGGDGAGDIGMNSATQVAVGTNLAYARRIELGFTGTDARGRTYNQPARSYLRKALDEQRDAAIREVASAFRDLLRAAVS